ncbi:MAG: hydantoinase B/oxoprolinase family protein, partial [Pseudomonadota bacterium]
TDPERFANAGTFEPLVVHTRPGTIFHARGTAPHGYYFETRMRLFDMLWHCLAKAMPGLLPAGHFATIFGTVIAGRHADTGRTYTMVEPQMGGWGATVDRDGIDAMYSTSHGDTYNCPAEIAEARYGFEVEQKELRQRTDNPTGWQGGRGVSTVYRLRAPAVLSVGMSHAEVPTWSLNQGRDGGINSLKVCEPGGSEKAFRFVSGLTLGPGSKVIIETAHGGGIQRLD